MGRPAAEVLGNYVFKRLCINCNFTRTRRVDEYGRPFCVQCEIVARMKARPDPLRCPVDGAALSKEILEEDGDFIADVCPACGGTWLEAADLRLMRKYDRGRLRGFLASEGEGGEGGGGGDG